MPSKAGLAEDHVSGSDVGPLFQAIMVDQFTRLRDGDRFFYQNENFNADENSFLQQGNTLAKVIEANTNVTNLQSDVMKFQASISGRVVNANSPFRFGQGVANVTLDLEDASGDLLATTRTDAQGNYRFTQLSTGNTDASVTPGVSATGIYQVVLAPSGTFKQTSPNSQPLTITAGDTVLNGVNFTVTAPPDRNPIGPGASHLAVSISLVTASIGTKPFQINLRCSWKECRCSREFAVSMSSNVSTLSSILLLLLSTLTLLSRERRRVGVRAGVRVGAGRMRTRLETRATPIQDSTVVAKPFN